MQVAITKMQVRLNLQFSRYAGSIMGCGISRDSMRNKC